MSYEEWRYVRTVPGGPLTPHQKQMISETTKLYIECRNALDPEPLISRLAPQVRWVHQSVWEEITGFEAVGEYFRERWAFIQSKLGQRDTGYCWLGLVDVPEGQGYPCAVFECDGIRKSVTTLKLDDDHRITEILGATVAPHPEEAYQ